MKKNKGTAFIACSKRKKNGIFPAKKLYQGTLFKKAFSYAFKNYENIYILSAKYGIIHPDEKIKYYDLSLNTMSKIEKLKWAELVKKQIAFLDLPKPFIFFTGKNYHEFFEGEKPLTGLSIGKQLQWFNQKEKEEMNKFF